MSASQPPAPPPPAISEDVWCKNRLQQYTQKAAMPLPVYETINEGAQHVPQFRSRVWVDGMCFISPNTFSNRKMAEQDAAKHAFFGIREKVKDEGFSRILEDTVFCKSIINEYALKMNLNAPTYLTNESKAMLPMFVSSLILNGVTFIGEAGKNKREAEQLAARSAILSILGSESGTTMSEIVKSKYKLYDAMKKVKNSSGGANPLKGNGALSLNKRKEVGVNHQPLQEFKKTSLEEISPPLVLVMVPPPSENPLTSKRKRNRKNKKAKKLKANRASEASNSTPCLFSCPVLSRRHFS